MGNAKPTRRGRRIVWALGISLLLVAAGLGYYLFRPGPAAPPVVMIASPHHASQVQVGQATTIQATARDKSKVTRVELWVDGALLETQASPRPQGISPFPVLTSWRPTATGVHTVTVRAFNKQGRRTSASVRVEALAAADRDNDLVPDATDACPDRVGPASSRGCPIPDTNDRDGDQVLDSADACPDQPGLLSTKGCPDADGDQVADNADQCPHKPGPTERQGCPAPGDADADGIVDSADACPQRAGPTSTRGCPDRDRDSIVDARDTCPDEPGPVATGGCPDRDGDSVPDRLDLCAETAGAPTNSGCPVSSAGDRDADGVHDDTDLSPDEPGLAEHGGSPPPGSGTDGDSDGSPDAEEPPDVFYIPPLHALPLLPMPPPPEPVRVEVEAMALRATTPHIQDVTCYFSLAGGAEEQVGPFASLEPGVFDIATLYGGENSRVLNIPPYPPLAVEAECEGYLETDELAPRTLVPLGTYSASHPFEEWDGRVFRAISQEAENTDFHVRFNLEYRICSPSCEESEFPAPTILNEVPFGPFAMTMENGHLYWTWEGDESKIDYFEIEYGCGPRGVVHEPTGYVMAYGDSSPFMRNMLPPHFWSRDITPQAPFCDQSCTYTVRAIGSDPEEHQQWVSPRSNAVVWEAKSCPVTIKTTFLEAGGATGSSFCEAGPIIAQVSVGDQLLNYDAAHRTGPQFAEGYTLHHDAPRYDACSFSFDQLVDEIAQLRRDCDQCDEYSAPMANFIRSTFDEGDDYNILFRVYEMDTSGHGPDTPIVAERFATLPADYIRNGDLGNAPPDGADPGSSILAEWDPFTLFKLSHEYYLWGTNDSRLIFTLERAW